MRTIVVGASSGLGRCIGIGLAKRGAHVALLARRRENLEDAANEAGPPTVAIECDVTDETSCRSAIAEAAAALGGIDALVYAPGIGPLARLADTDASTWRKVFDTNVTGAALVTSAAITELTASAGRAAYLSSVSASLTPPWPGLGAYAVSKAALDKLVEAWRAEHPSIGFTRVVVGDCGGGDGDAQSQFATGWNMDLAAELFPVWSARNYLSGSLMDVDELVSMIDAVLRGGASLSIPSITVAPAPTHDVVNAVQLSAALVSYATEAPPSWNTMLETACLYDRVGIDRLVLSDHVVFGEQLDAYAQPEIGGQRGGRQPTGPDGHWLEPMTTLSVIAGMTERVRLSTGILLAALRRPVVLAKTAATLDVLSGGRLDLGVGVGWQREEYEAAGLDFDRRGRLLDHTLEVCTALWTHDTARYQSPELDFERIHMMPKPLQPGGVPIWVSGTINARVVDRLCRFGLRWIPWGDDAVEIEQSIGAMRERIAATGTSPDSLQVVANLRVFKTENGTIDVERTMEPVPGLVAAGATDLRVRPPVREPDAETEAGLHDLVAAFHIASGQA